MKCIRLLLTTLLLSLLFFQFGAAEDDGGIKIIGKGFKIGLTLSNWGGADNEFTMPSDPLMRINPTSRSHLSHGVFITFGISSQFSIQSEANYVIKGCKYNILGYLGTQEDLIFFANFGYLEFPILFKYTFTKEQSFTPSIFIGPALAFKIKADLGQEMTGNRVFYDMGNVKSPDFSFVLGGGIEFPIGNQKISLDGRYNFGLGSLVGDEEFTSSGLGLFGGDEDGNTGMAKGLDIKNNNFLFTLGFVF